MSITLPPEQINGQQLTTTKDTPSNNNNPYYNTIICDGAEQPTMPMNLSLLLTATCAPISPLPPTNETKTNSPAQSQTERKTTKTTSAQAPRLL